ncbi:MAG: Hsp20/alpha crystallin family protein [Fervidicoccaceae archaeon]
MSWDDEFEILRSYVRRRMKELEKELESAFSLTSAPLFGEFFPQIKFDEPLHQVYLLENECVVIIDAPLLDNSSISVEAEKGRMRIEGKMRKTVRTEELGYSTIRKEISSYYKEISIPTECDVSRMSYSFKKGRIIVRMPRS